MILFLDTVSPLPEFSLIEDNKIIYSRGIIKNDTDKMSDSIISTYIDLENQYIREKNLKYLIVNTGPGSYTSLRVGIAFLTGLGFSKNISIIGVACYDLFNFNLFGENLNTSAFLINSSNNQIFICIYDPKKKNYNIHKIDKEIKIDLSSLKVKKIYTNSSIQENIYKNFRNIEIKEISFTKLVLKNLQQILSLPLQDIIEPIYISNNKILN